MNEIPRQTPGTPYYEGEKKNGKPHGLGRYTFSDGTYYEGQHEDGDFHGKGYMTYGEDSNFADYYGDWARDKWHGSGKLVWKNGTCYEGNFVEGNFSGKGTFTWSDGTRYEGDFEEDLRHGFGRYTFEDGSYYEGEHHKGNFHGEGFRLYAESSKLQSYCGRWSNGKRNGRGKLTWKDGDFYEGDFLEDDRTGQGSFVWTSGAKYEGDFIEGLRHGFGRYTFEDGSYYEGEHHDGDFHGEGFRLYAESSKLESYCGRWSNGKRNGRGKLAWKDGDYYEGDFLEGDRTGQGSFVWTSGAKYEGDFKDGLRHGFGKFTYDSGNTSTGYWLKNKKDGLHLEEKVSGVTSETLFDKGREIEEIEKAYPEFYIDLENDGTPVEDVLLELAKHTKPDFEKLSSVPGKNELGQAFASEVTVPKGYVHCALKHSNTEPIGTVERKCIQVICLVYSGQEYYSTANTLIKEILVETEPEHYRKIRAVFRDYGLPALCVPFVNADLVRSSEDVEPEIAERRTDLGFRIEVGYAILQTLAFKQLMLDKTGYASGKELVLSVHKSDQISSSWELEERRDVFDELTTSETAHIAICALDLSHDLTRTDIMHSIGLAFGNPNYAIYNSRLKKAYFTFLALISPGAFQGCTMPEFHLGHLYNRGETGRIDRREALFWFEQTGIQGHGMGFRIAAEILEELDGELPPDQQGQQSASISSFMKLAESSGQPCVESEVARRHFFGKDEWDNPVLGEAHYEKVLVGDFWGTPQTDDLKGYACRKIVFYEDYSGAIAVLQTLLEKTRESLSPRYYFDANYGKFFRTMRSILGRHGLEFDGNSVSQSNSYKKDFLGYVKLCLRSYKLDMDVNSFDKEVSIMLETDGINLEACHDAAYLLKELSNQEGWHNRKPLQDAFRTVNAARCSLEISDLRASALRFGPNYNELDVQTSLPVLSHHLSPSKSEDDEVSQFETMGYFTPAAGIQNITKVIGHKNGSISVECETSDDHPAFILQEDLKVARILAFGGAEGVVWPSLSLERNVEGVLEDQNEMFEAKVFKPAWLGYTNFGRTLYIVDALTGCLTWSPYLFRHATPEQAFDRDFAVYAKKLLDDLQFTGGGHMVSTSRRIMLSPDTISNELLKSSDGKRLEVVLHQASVRINGSYIRKTDDSEDRRLGWNDERLEQGRLTQRLTDHYFEICLMMPVFERYRQLLAMLYGFADLRNAGFEPNADLRSKISNELADFKSKNTSCREDAIVEEFPFLNPMAEPHIKTEKSDGYRN